MPKSIAPPRISNAKTSMNNRASLVTLYRLAFLDPRWEIARIPSRVLAYRMAACVRGTIG